MEQKLDFVQQLKDWENSAADILGIIGTWIVPIPSAYLIFRAAVHTLEWHWPIAFLLAAAIEILGIVSIVTALELKRWNDTISTASGDEEAPFWLAAVLVGIYLTAMISLTILVEIFPTLARFSAAIMPILTLVAGGIISIRRSQQDREGKKADRLKKRREARAKSGKKKDKKQQADPQQAEVPKPKPTTDEERIQQMYVYMMANPNATCKELGEKIGRSSGWVSQTTRRLIDEGSKLKKNGHGWEVIG